jgi:hypothetical protein
LRNAEKDFLIEEDGSIVKYVGKQSEVVIPALKEDTPITVIKERSFRGKHLTNVIIPSSVTAIENQAFMNNRLSSVTIPENVTSIGDEAFMNNQLTGVILPENVTSLGDEVFLNNQITNITIGANVTLGRGANPLDPFGNDFRSYYIDNRERAGTYEYTDGKWIWRGVTATIIGGTANIRSAPDSTKNNVIATLKKGDVLTVTGSVNNGWLPVEVDGQGGYVSTNLVDMEK